MAKNPLNIPIYDPFLKPVPVPGVEPDEGVKVCVELNQEWIAYILGALWPLTYPDKWQGAAAARELAVQQTHNLIAMFAAASACLEPCMIRQSPENPCIIQQSQDNGETWQDVVDLSLCAVPGPPGADGNTPAPVWNGTSLAWDLDGDGVADVPGVDLVGPPGADGADGAPGAPGADGADGNTPAPVWTDTVLAWDLDGDGAADVPGVDLVGPAGPAGADGAPGAPGADGADGNTPSPIWNGTSLAWDLDGDGLGDTVAVNLKGDTGECGCGDDPGPPPGDPSSGKRCSVAVGITNWVKSIHDFNVGAVNDIGNIAGAGVALISALVWFPAAGAIAILTYIFNIGTMAIQTELNPDFWEDMKCSLYRLLGDDAEITQDILDQWKSEIASLNDIGGHAVGGVIAHTPLEEFRRRAFIYATEENNVDCVTCDAECMVLTPVTFAHSKPASVTDLSFAPALNNPSWEVVDTTTLQASRTNSEGNTNGLVSYGYQDGPDVLVRNQVVGLISNPGRLCNTLSFVFAGFKRGPGIGTPEYWGITIDILESPEDFATDDGTWNWTRIYEATITQNEGEYHTINQAISNKCVYAFRIGTSHSNRDKLVNTPTNADYHIIQDVRIGHE